MQRGRAGTRSIALSGSAKPSTSRRPGRGDARSLLVSRRNVHGPRQLDSLRAPFGITLRSEAYHEHQPSSRRHRSPLGESAAGASARPVPARYLRAAARASAGKGTREMFRRFPTAAYMTEIETLARTPRRPHRVHYASASERGLISTTVNGRDLSTRRPESNRICR